MNVRFVKYSALALLLMLALLVTAIVVGPQMVDWSKNKDKLEGFISAASGYKVRLNGEISFQTLPAPKIFVEHIVVEPFTGTQNIFEAQNFSAEASLWRLMTLRLDLTHVALDNPVITLHTASGGDSNFSNPKQSHSRGPSDLGPISSLGVLNIKNAHIVMVNEAAKTRREITGMNLAIDGTTLRNTQLDISGMLDKVPFTVKGVFGLDNLQELNIRANFTYADSQVTLKGVISDIAKKPAYDGHLGMDVTNPAHLVQTLLQKSKAMALPIQKFTFLGNLTATPARFKVENMEMTADDIKASGFVDYRVGKNANLTAKMRLEKLNLDKFLAANDTASSQGQLQASDDAWDDTYIDFTPWRDTNAKVDLSVGEMIWNGRPIRQASLRFNNQDGTLSLEGLDMSVGSGYFRATGRADLGNPLRGQLDIKLENLPVNFLVSEEKANLFDVPLNAEGQFLFAGNSQSEMVKSLGGQFTMQANQGTIKGVNLVDLNKTMQAIFLGKSIGGESTLQTFNATFAVENGVIKNEDLDLRSDPIVIKGKGKIDLVQKAINFKFRPMTAERRLGVLLPVNVVGPLSGPKIIPDILTPQGIVSAVGAVAGGPAGAALGAILGTEADKAIQTDSVGKLLSVPFNFQDGKNLKENVKNFFMGKPPLPDSTVEEKPVPVAPAQPASGAAQPLLRGGLLPPPQGQ